MGEMSDNEFETQARNPNDDLIGRTIGQFTIKQEIGRGGMATVYSATQSSIGRTVAIKVLPRHFLHDPGFLERFKREVDVISKLEHPHILPIYDYGEDDGVPYIAMRFLGGGSMAEMVRRGVPELPDLVKPFTQVADALDYAHQQGVIHRDLKPGNIMLDEYGNAYLSDFGIARVMGSDLTGSAIVGTPAYMSPEQAQGGPIDSRSDIYALGIVLFEMITGREPYQAETPMSMLLKHINEPVPPVSDFRQGVPDSVEAVVERATSKNPDERYASASELARTFEQALTIGDTAVRRAAPTEPSVRSRNEPQQAYAAPQAVIENPQTESAQTVEPTSTVTPARNRAPLLVGAIIVVVLLVGGGVLLLPQLGGQTEVAPVPTPFRSAMTVDNDEGYTISMPESWASEDESDVQRISRVWVDERDGVTIRLSLVDTGDLSIDGYTTDRFGDREFRFIDEVTAEDGTVRQSYRVENHNDLPNGQVDVFFRVEETRLTALEMFTPDGVATNSVTLDTLQLVLDSLRLQ